jgi:hypothetical protein
MSTTPAAPTVKDLLEGAKAAQDQIMMVIAGLTLLLHEESEIPYLDPKLSRRVARLGEVAHRHLAFIEERGAMTLGDSLAIRRELFGTDVQATANLFGHRGSGALLYRDVPYKTPRADNQPVKMTDEGVRIARLWRDTHPATT